MMCCKTVCNRRGNGMAGQGRTGAGQDRGMVRLGGAEQGTFDESHHAMMKTAEKLTLSDMEVSARLNPLS